MVLLWKSLHGSDENQDLTLDISKAYVLTQMPTFIEKNRVDDVHATCDDHRGGGYGRTFLLDHVRNYIYLIVS